MTGSVVCISSIVCFHLGFPLTSSAVPVMKLVEVVRTPKTDEETFETLMEVTKRMGKVPVKAKDKPGCADR